MHVGERSDYTRNSHGTLPGEDVQRLYPRARRIRVTGVPSSRLNFHIAEEREKVGALPTPRLPFPRASPFSAPTHNPASQSIQRARGKDRSG